MPLPDINPLTSRQSRACLDPHGHPNVQLCQAPQSPKHGTPRTVGWGSRWPTQAGTFRSEPSSYRGPVLSPSGHLLPHRHLKLGRAPSFPPTPRPQAGRDNPAVTNFLPGNHMASSHPGTHFLLIAGSSRQSQEDLFEHPRRAHSPPRPTPEEPRCSRPHGLSRGGRVRAREALCTAPAPGLTQWAEIPPDPTQSSPPLFPTRPPPTAHSLWF